MEAPAEIAPFGIGTRQPMSLAVRDRGFVPAVKAAQQIGASSPQQVVVVQSAGSIDGVDDRESDFGAVGHRDRDRTIQLHDWGRRHLREFAVERGDLRPVGIGRLTGGRVTRRDGGLHLIRAGPTSAQRTLEHRDRLLDRDGVPQQTILRVEQHEVAEPVDARGSARVVQQHECEQPDHLRLVGHELGQRSAKANCLRTQTLTYEVGAGGRGVSLVEQEIQHGQYCVRAFRKQMTWGHPIRDPRIANLVLRADQTLRHRGFRYQERTTDLSGRQTGERS